MKVKQDMCRVCCTAFNSKDIVIQYWEWVNSDEADGPWLGHLDCMLYISKMEKRKHLPSSKKR